MKQPIAKPSLLVVTTTFPRWQDDPGPAPFVLHHARALSDHFKVTVLAPHFPGAAREENLEGVAVRRFPYAWPESLETLADGAGIRSHLRKGFTPKLLAGLLTLSLGLALRRELRRGGSLYLNSHWLVPAGLMATLAAPARVRHVITVHAADYDLLSRLPGGGRIVRFLARRARAVVCVSSRLAEGVRAMAGPGAEIVTLPMGVDHERFYFDESARRDGRARLGIGPDDGVVLFAGKFSPKKGAEVLLRAFAALPDQSVRLIMVGDGELRPSLEALTGELGLTGRVSWRGSVPNRELARLYSAADVVAVPSVSDARGETEGMPVVILEALFSGRPVVATALCGVPSVLRGRGVEEVEAGDIPALCAALVRALAGEIKVEAEAVRAFDLAPVAGRYARLLKEDES